MCTRADTPPRPYAAPLPLIWQSLHLAASEGLLPVVDMLLDELHAKPNPLDRWGNTPLDDARRSGHSGVAERLTAAGGQVGAEYVGNSGRSGVAFTNLDLSVHSNYSTGSTGSDGERRRASARTCSIL